MGKPKAQGENNKPRIFCQRRRWNSFVRRRRWKMRTNKPSWLQMLQWAPARSESSQPTLANILGLNAVRPPSSLGLETNCDKSPTLLSQRSWRHGCPLSPLLFAPAIEPLAISRRNHASVAPLVLGKVDHRISLCACDAVLFLSHPEESLPPLLELHTFGERSGYNYKLGQERIHVCQRSFEAILC